MSRYAGYPGDGVGELAITVADARQHKGLGRLLFNQLITYAKAHGMKQLYSVELADNIAMRELANEFRMSVKRDPDDPSQVIFLAEDGGQTMRTTVTRGLPTIICRKRRDAADPARGERRGSLVP